MRSTARYREAERRLWDSVGLQPTERQLSLATTGTTVRVQEVGDGPPVVFVHGATTSGASWATLVAELDGFRCVLLDRPGCGLSEPVPRPFTEVGALEAFADELLVDVLDALHLPSADVVATSFGGYLALRAAGTHPERFERLVELGWAFGAPIARTPLPMRLAAVRGIGRLLASVPPTRSAVRAMLRQVGLRQALAAGRVSDEVIDCYLSLLRDTATMRNEIDAGPRLIRPIAGMDVRLLLSPEVLARVTAPTLFLWGDEDVFGGAETARAFVKQIVQAELRILPGAGHAPWLDDGPGVAAATAGFLARDA